MVSFKVVSETMPTFYCDVIAEHFPTMSFKKTDTITIKLPSSFDNDIKEGLNEYTKFKHFHDLLEKYLDDSTEISHEKVSECLKEINMNALFNIFMRLMCFTMTNCEQKFIKDINKNC